MTRSIEALLFDLGGVVVGIDFDRIFEVWSAHSGVPARVIGSRFAFDVHYEAHERGEISANRYFESLRSSLALNLSDEQFLDGWNAVFLGEVPGMAALLGSLQGRMPLYLFSNSNSVHQEYWAGRYAPALRNFRKVFVSSDLGLRKPEPAAFAAVAKEIGVPFENILFFDDTETNVQGAKNMGMQAVRFTSIADVENAVADIQAAR